MLNSQALQQSVKHPDEAFRRFFGNQGRYPQFRSRRGRQPMPYPQRVKVVGGNSLCQPTVGTVRVVVHREIDGRIKTVTICRTATGKRSASVLANDGRQASDPPKSVDAEAVIEVGPGLEHLAVISDGGKVDSPRFSRRTAANLRRKQKSLSRTVEGSANRGRARPAH